VKSVEMREAAERAAAEKQKKNLDIYLSWKAAVLRKYQLSTKEQSV
jgi:hypothetical protein